MNEVRFTPHFPGKMQKMTYDILRDHILNQVQCTFRHGNNIAKAIHNMMDMTPGTQLIKQTVIITWQTFDDDRAKFNVKLGQQGYDILYKEELRAYNIKTNLQG